MKFILLTTLLCIQQIVSLPSNAYQRRNIDDKFAAHKKEYNLQFGSAEEEAAAKANFAKVDAFIEEHNSKPGPHSTLGHNEFSTWSAEQKKKRNGFIPASSGSMSSTHVMSKRSAPSSIDWRNYNGVNYVNTPAQQGQCGSCWTFSATATIESRYAIKSGTLLQLSQQNIIDCCKFQSGMNGCNGGMPSHAFNYVASKEGAWVGQIIGSQSGPKSVVGQDLLSSYPLKNCSLVDNTDGTCDFTSSGVDTTTVAVNGTYGLSASVEVPAQDPNAMMDAVAQGPVSVAIDAGEALQHYKSGHMFPNECGTNLDHAVQIIGYGTDSIGDYWLLKNSWGTGWGDNGFFKFSRQSYNSAGTCGVLLQGQYPNL